MPLEFTLAIDDNPLIYKGENIVLAVNTWMWYNVVMESSHRKEFSYMSDRTNLLVDYEDQVDWLQDSIVIENVDLEQDHYNLIVELEQSVYDATRLMHNPPSSHIQIMGFCPADSDVVVKNGVNYWHSDENIFS